MCIYQVYTVYNILIYKLKYLDILAKVIGYTMYMLCIYYTDVGYIPSIGLDIMLLKLQFLSVSGQEANPARQHPPVENVYRSSHPILQFLPQKLAEWIANN